MKPIDFLPGYLAGDDGYIYSLHPKTRSSAIPSTPRKLKGKIDASSGYFSVHLGTKRYTVHRLICHAFHGPQPIGMEACHGVEGKLENRPENICWGTRSKNLGSDKRRDGTSNEGQRNGRSKLTIEKVEAIRHPDNSDFTQEELAHLHGVSQHQISTVLNYKSWKNI